MKGVIFDLDGTLIDSEPLWARAETAVAASGGVLWTAEDAVSCFGRPLAVTAQAIIDRGLDLTVTETIDRMTGELVEIYRARVPWLPGAVELLSELHGAGILTALGTQSVRPLASAIQGAAPAGTLTELVTGDELVNGKPDPEVFLTAIDRLGLASDDVVIVEDSPTGVAAGVAAGVPVLAVPPSEEIYRSYVGKEEVSIVSNLTQVNAELLGRIRTGEKVDLWGANSMHP
ncbi:HAD family phosphatase [Corynebacterium glyciniphilum]|uniref:HAD family hydrolase n=1 Tax=Corynebacterium glyciniphilum TaxID=1404244 RepID=UPI002355782E